MTIRKKSKEELEDQAKGFLEYAEQNGKVDEKTEKEVSKILGLNEDEKKGFLERLSSKFGREVDIGSKGEIEKVLKKKHIDFEKIWEEYTKYLRAINFFEPYKNINPELNDDIIMYIIKSENINLNQLKLFLLSNIYKNCSRKDFSKFTLDYILGELSVLLDYKDFKDLLNLCGFYTVSLFSCNQSINVYNIKSYLIIKKNTEILDNDRNLDKFLEYVTYKRINDEKFNQLKINLEIYGKHLFLIKYLDGFDDFFSKDFGEIINSKKGSILSQDTIWFTFHVGKKSLSEEQKQYLESIFDGYVFDLSDTEKLKELFKLPEIKKEPTIIDRLKAFNDIPKISPLGDVMSPIKLFGGDDSYDLNYFKNLTGLSEYSLSEEQKQFLESIFDGYTFDLSPENEEKLIQLFPPKKVIQETDILTRLDNFNIIKTEIPNVENEDFEKYGVYSHLLNDIDSKKLSNYLKSLKELGFDKKDDLLEMLIYGSNEDYSSNGDCYLDDVLEITKLYMDTLGVSSTEILDIYKMIFHHSEHKNLLEQMFTKFNAGYIDLYKKRDNIIALKELGLSSKVIISSQFTPVEVFQKLIDLGVTIDEINRIFDEDPEYNGMYDKYFEFLIQGLLKSNRYYGYFGYDVKGTLNGEKSNIEIENLYNLLAPSKREYILPFLHEISNNVYVDVSEGSNETKGQKIFEMIDVITNKIDIEEFLQFFKGCNLKGNVIESVKKMELIVNYFIDSNVNTLESLKKIIVDCTIETTKNLEVVFRYRSNIGIDELISMQELLASAMWWNLEMLFKKYPNITVNKLIGLKDVLGFQHFASNFELIHDYFEPFEYGDFKTYKKLISFSGMFPKNLQFKDSNHKGYLGFLDNIAATSYDNAKKNLIMEKVVTLPFDEAEKYLEIFKMFDESISMDVQRIKNELIDEILKSDNPEEIAKSINDIFERNNLPLTGKIFKVFELLYPKDKLKSTLQSHGSPVLHQYLDEGKNVYSLIYKDLMNIAIKSGDRSLKQYISTFIGSGNLIKNFEALISEDGFNQEDSGCLEGKMSEDEQEKLLYLFRRISVLYNRYFGKKITEGAGIEDVELGKYNVSDDKLIQLYNDIKKGFHLKKGESIYDRLQRFLYGLGYRSFQEVLEDMDIAKSQAHERGLKLYNESNGGKIYFPKQGFLKGVNKTFFSKLINRGITCREYLGGGDDGTAAGSDATPFDIDGLYVDAPVDWEDYGNILLITDTNRCDIVDTREKGLAGYKETQYELFKTGVVNGNHYGIRTGIPTTEIDYIIYYGNFEKKEFQDMCYEIARNGYYIPIVDGDGNIKFTPEMYHKIRACFNFMEYYDGYDVELKDGKYVSCKSDNRVNKFYNGTNEKINDEELWKLIEENSPSNDKYKTFARENRELAENTIERIKRILEEKCGIKFNSKYDSSITGAEIHDSGSTGRGTDIPTKDVDLDFTLLLDVNDYNEKLKLIREIIYKETGTTNTDGEGERTGGFQLKSKKNSIGQSDERPDGISLDLLVLKKSQVIDYSSSDAMKEKLDYIVRNLETGTEDLDRVRTNVIIMKKLLKSQSCYKKTSTEGGIAGIGVENWITQHHGSFVEALESFEQVAYGGKYLPGRNSPISLEEFKKQYPMYDAGKNYKDGCNDNFVDKLNEHGYNGMLEIVRTLRLEGLEGIRRLIKEYEKKKKEYTG